MWVPVGAAVAAWVWTRPEPERGDQDDDLAVLRCVNRLLKPGGTIAIAEWLMNDDRTGPPPALIFAGVRWDSRGQHFHSLLG